MKKFLAFVLVVMFVVATVFSGCGKSSKVTGVGELIEKYKRADFGKFLESPEEFVSDTLGIFGAINYKYPSEDVKQRIRGTEDRDEKDFSLKGYKQRNSDAVLFNRSVDFSVIYNEPDWSKTMCFQLDISFNTGNWEEDYEIAKSLIDDLFNRLGDPTSYSVGSVGNAVTEAEFRRDFYNLRGNILTHGDAGFYMVFWKSIGDAQSTPCCVSFSYDISLAGIASKTLLN